MDDKDKLKFLEDFTRDCRSGPRNSELICKCDDNGDIDIVSRGNPICVLALAYAAAARCKRTVDDMYKASGASGEFCSGTHQILINWAVALDNPPQKEQS